MSIRLTTYPNDRGGLAYANVAFAKVVSVVLTKNTAYIDVVIHRDAVASASGKREVGRASMSVRDEEAQTHPATQDEVDTGDALFVGEILIDVPSTDDFSANFANSKLLGAGKSPFNAAYDYLKTKSTWNGVDV